MLGIRLGCMARAARNQRRLSMAKKLDISQACVVVDPRSDNVGVAKTDLERGTVLSSGRDGFVLRSAVSKGQHIALVGIDEGEHLIQYGYSFGVSRGIVAGGHVGVRDVADLETDMGAGAPCVLPKTVFREEMLECTFEGYRRQDGRVGTRNYYLVVPTSLCASGVATQIAREAMRRANGCHDMAHVDGIVAIPHTEGCGCASNGQIDRLLRVLKNYICHPNVGGALVVDLGCEQTNHRAFRFYLERSCAVPTGTVDFLTIQAEGGSTATVAKGADVIGRRLAPMNGQTRATSTVEHLVVGAECGASDSFSGITANRVIGALMDGVIAGGGTAIMNEVTEMLGAEHVLMRRMRDGQVVEKFKAMMARYSDLARRLDVSMSDNLVEENRSGGLVNLCLKSLGAIVKGGTANIEDILEYGDKPSKRGLHIMDGPGNDMESVTGLASSGSNLVCSSTGRGAITGNAIVPVVKVSSTTDLYDRMPDDIDFDAGRLLHTDISIGLDEMGGELLDLVLSVASGQKTKAEQNGQSQFQVWTAGKLSL